MLSAGEISPDLIRLIKRNSAEKHWISARSAEICWVVTAFLMTTPLCDTW